MTLKEQFSKSGNWLFRWRSYPPVVLVVLGFFALPYFRITDSRSDQLWELLCLSVSLAGLGIRVYTIGYAHKGTSGRNTTHQKAEVLNKTGIYSIVRNPLYLGNFFIWFGLSMFFRLWWFSLIVSLAFWIYYERIIFAEEEFLAKKFGNEFLEWCGKTPAFIPRFRNWTPTDVAFAYRTVLKREQSGLLAITATFTLFEVLGDYLNSGQLRLETMWAFIFFGGLGIFLTLTGLKKAHVL